MCYHCPSPVADDSCQQCAEKRMSTLASYLHFNNLTTQNKPVANDYNCKPLNKLLKPIPEVSNRVLIESLHGAMEDVYNDATPKATQVMIFCLSDLTRKPNKLKTPYFMSKSNFSFTAFIGDWLCVTIHQFINRT